MKPGLSAAASGLVSTHSYTAAVDEYFGKEMSPTIFVVEELIKHFVNTAILTILYMFSIEQR